MNPLNKVGNEEFAVYRNKPTVMVFVVQYWLSQLWTQFMQLRYVVWKIHGFYGVWTSKHIGVARSRAYIPFKSWFFSDHIKKMHKLRS